eukprot:g25333.t1
MPGIIIPRKTVGELQKLVDNPEAMVTVEVSDAKIRLTIGDIVMTSKLIDGTFPDYQRVIPTGNDKEMRVDCQTFTKAVDRVSTISSERGRAVKLSLSDGQLMLTVNNPDSGSATEEVAVGYDNDPLEIGFNAKYLLDITAQLSGDDAVFMLADAGSPTLVRDTAGDDALYVLMPMRAILNRGIAPADLVSIEYSTDFFQHLLKTFPGVNFINGDAFDLDRTLGQWKDCQFDSVISAIPMLSFPMERRIALLEDLLNRLPVGRPVVQITYSPVSPIIANPDRYKIKHYDFVVRNIPPAQLWAYTRG